MDDSFAFLKENDRFRESYTTLRSLAFKPCGLRLFFFFGDSGAGPGVNNSRCYKDADIRENNNEIIHRDSLLPELPGTCLQMNDRRIGGKSESHEDPPE